MHYGLVSIRDANVKDSGLQFVYRAIGIIHSPFRDPRDMPIQPTSEAAAEGFAEVFPQFIPALKDLDEFSHVILLYHFHRVNRVELLVRPYLDFGLRGLFATRAPTRPNPIGLSVVRLVRIEGPRLFLANLDILDGTPLLDIKPYVPQFDHPENTQIGWLEGFKHKIREARADDRIQ